jgi:hypothetical protein
MTVASTSAHAADRSPAKRRRRRWPIVLACLLTLAAIPIGGYLYLVWEGERDLEAAVAEIERGDPRWRFDDIIADRKPLADAENPALVVVKADALLPGNYDIGPKNWELFEKVPSVHRLNGPQIAALREAMAKHAAALEVARTLKDFTGEGRFTIKVAPDFVSTTMGPLQRCRGVMSMLQHDAFLRAEDGDVAGALESCQAVLVVARAIGDEPYLIAALIRFAGEAILVNTLEHTLAQGEAPKEQLKAMQDLLTREIDATFFLQAMRGERGGSDATFTALRTGTVKISALKFMGGDSLEDRFMDTFPAIMLRGRPEHLRLMHQAVEAARLPSEKQGEAFNQVDKATRASSAMVVRLLMPGIAKTSQANRRTRANLRCALAGVAAERYRLEHAKWPGSLDELAKQGWIAAVPLDPFDGQPLRYKIVADGVRIYSVGLDGVDDGGAIDRDNWTTPGTDLGFRLWNTGSRRPHPLPPPDDLGENK